MTAAVRAFVVGVAIQCVLIHHVATLHFAITADQVLQKIGGASFLLLLILANASDNEEHVVKKLQISNKKLRSLTLCL